jgi:GT2 family glycosyltransferase
VPSFEYPPLTVLILNWNGKKWLEQFLPSVVASTYPRAEILVADNGSSDDSLAFLAREYPEVRVLTHDQNYGFTEGNNKALPAIKTPFLVLLNSDVEVTPGWLEPMVDLMLSDPQIAAVQPKIRAQRQKDHFEYAGAAGGYLDRFAYPFCRGRIFDHAEPDQGQYDDIQDIFWASGACCLLRRSVIDEIGLFEPSFFAHMEEIDFCWRALNHGYRVVYQPESLVYHVGGGTLQKGSPRKTFLNIHNSLVMMYKNLPGSQVSPKIFARLCLDGVFALKLLLGGEVRQVGAILRAHFRFYGRLGFWRKRRRATYAQSPRRMPTSGYYPRSLVWQHFVKGKKRFSELEEKSG